MCFIYLSIQPEKRTSHSNSSHSSGRPIHSTPQDKAATLKSKPCFSQPGASGAATAPRPAGAQRRQARRLGAGRRVNYCKYS